ncbi:MAG: GNAT family N-acetyltransferase [Promethearchaeota archaeon]|jgi:RimJ/RimL family protein N-acetyltransferase
MYKIKDNIELIPFTRELAVGNYRNWWTDQDVTKYNSHGLFPQNEMDLQNYLSNLGNGNIVLAIISTEGTPITVNPINYQNNDVNVDITGYKYTSNYAHIGNVALQSINWINRSAELAIIIGEKDFWGKGIAKKVCNIMLYHGFQKLNLHRIWTGTAATNKGMNQVAINIGMKLEGKFIDAMFLEGKYINILEYGITEYDYEKYIGIAEGLIEKE